MKESTELLLPGFKATDAEVVAGLPLEERVARAVKLLQDNEPEKGYWLAFSGGKDSCVIKKLASMSGVKHQCWYNQTTIDPPELVRFIKTHHPDVRWNIPKHGNMMHRVATRPGAPPTRTGRWCCDEYKEQGGQGYIKIFGVRAEESSARKLRWREVTMDEKNYRAVCPIVYWTHSQVWEFLRGYNVPYCSLYDEGWSRLGCVGCPLNPEAQTKEFERWPAFKRNWERAVKASWERYHNALRKDGKPYYHSRFKTAEEFWTWWLTKQPPDHFREECQSMILWTNAPAGDSDDQQT